MARKVFLGAAALTLVAAGCAKQEQVVVPYQAVAVETRNIVVSARAAGTVQPDTVVEVKSKASGEILEMRAETGALVQRGTLIVRVDQRGPRNTVNQAEANLEVAKARLSNAEAQKRRADQLFQSQSITQEEHENAVLAVANAKAEVVRGEVEVENARIQMEDTDVRAPITGTIIAKNAERGQVISSPTRDVGGGTVLLTMADLNLVQVRTLVDETDIGKISQGLDATVTVDAYPNQPFEGSVLKIEPKAETEQNVTKFPVLIRIDNRRGLLKPGMNADVEIHIGQRDNVLAIPNAALRTQRDVGSAAQVLGISPEEVQQMLAAGRDSAAGRPASRPDSGKADAKAPSGNTMTTPDGRTIQLPEGVTETKVREIFRKRFSGGQLTAEEQAIMQQLQRSFGGRRGGGRPQGGSGSSFEFGGSYIVFVLRDGRPTAVSVRTGLTDLDYSEVVSGVTAADSVLILPSASLVQSQQEFRERIGRMTGGGAVPGMQNQSQSSTRNAPSPPRGGGPGR